MAHIALYRSWRPQAFREMVGQKPIIQTLQNALKERRFSHAYLFSGPRGTGKTSAAKILAKAVNCENGPDAEPCNQCAACLHITEGTIMDVVEIDAASNRGVEEIRDIRDKIRFAPTEVRYKVYIIDEVHMLTSEAFNALLKTLEEPPAHAMFILATTEPHRLPTTIVSRCQRFDFRRVSLQEQVERLEQVCRQEHIQAEPEALQYIARLSDGGMRDALSLLDQISSYSNGRVTYSDVLAITGGVASDQFEKLAKAIRANDVGMVLEVIDAWMQEGKSADKCLESLMLYFRDLLLVRMVPGNNAVTERIIDSSFLRNVSVLFSQGEIISIIETLNTYQAEMRYSAQPQTLFELAVMKICSLTSEGSPGKGESAVQERPPQQNAFRPDESLAELVRKLEKQVARLEQQIAELSAGKKETSEAGPAQTNAPETRSSAAARRQAPFRKSGLKLDPFLQKPSDSFKNVSQKWSQLLSRVKEKKITVHAWLIDGEPVAVHEDTILVAFKSTMHRETTERPANKQLIEQALAEVFGQPLKLATVMMKEWQDARSEMEQAQGTGSPETGQTGGSFHREEWIEEAIQLFGENLVTIKED